MSLKHGPLNHSRLVTRNLRVSNRRGWNALVFFLQGTCEFEAWSVESLSFSYEELESFKQEGLECSRFFLQGTCEFEVGHIETLLFILEDIVTLEQGLLKRSRLFGRDL